MVGSLLQVMQAQSQAVTNMSYFILKIAFATVIVFITTTIILYYKDKNKGE